MTVEPWQLQQNAVLDVDGSRGFVLSTDAGLTSVVRDNGMVEFYTTESIAENASVHEDSPVQAAPAPQPATTPQPQPVDQPTQQPTDQPPVATGVNDPVQPVTPAATVPPDSTTPDTPQPSPPVEVSNAADLAAPPLAPPPTPDVPQAVPVQDQPTPDNNRQQTP